MAIIGHKGGKATAGGQAPQESPNTLHARSKARVVDLIGEGEIEGLVDGLKSIYFDDVTLQNSDDSYNFEGVNVWTRAGLPTQDAIPGIAQVESEVVVGTEVTATNAVEATITDNNLDAVVVKVRLPALTVLDSESGNLGGGAVAVAVDLKKNDATYTEVVRDTIRGKTTAPYVRSYRISVVRASDVISWTVRVRRLTDDHDDDATINDQTYFSSYVKVIDAKLTYPDSALIGVSVDSEQFGSSIPNRSYDIKGIKVQVPVNYDPLTRVYTGVWDGTFKRAWTDNPAWVLYDILTSNRYGLGDFIGAADVDKFTLYTVGQYCDGVVSDGKDSTEPRFTFNGIINSRRSAYQAINELSSVFRGMMYYAAGTITAAHDAPGDPVKLVSESNVIDGEFKYSGMALKDRHTAVAVTWNNPDDGYRAAVELVEDADLARSLGWRQTDIQAVGCTSRSQAHRLGKWLLDSEKHETQTLTYRASFDHADLRPGDIIAVSDPHVAGKRYGGRLKSATMTVLTVDRLPAMLTGTWRVSVVLPSGAVEQKPINAIDTTAGTLTLTTANALSETPQTGAMWVIESGQIAPREFRVIAVTESEKNIYEISALEHSAGKYARVEQGVNLPAVPFSILPSAQLSQPIGLVLGEHLYFDGNVVKPALDIAVTAPANARATLFDIEVRGPSEPAYRSVHLGSDPTFELRDAVAGEWHVRARMVTAIGRRGPWRTATHNLIGRTALPAQVPNFSVDEQPDGTREYRWDSVSDLDVRHGGGYRIRWALGNASSWHNMTALHSGLLTSSPYESNLLPAGAYTVAIKAVDSLGHESENATLVSVDLGNPRLHTVLYRLYAHTAGWPGTITNAVRDDLESYLTAVGTLNWDELDNGWDNFDEWSETPSQTIQYETPVIDVSEVIPFVPLITATADGSIALEYATSTDGITFTPYATVDGEIQTRYVKFRISVSATSTAPLARLKTLLIILNAELVSERLFGQYTDLTGWSGSASEGWQIPLQRSFSKIMTMNVALSAGSGGYSWDIVSKKAIAPKIKIYDAANTAIGLPQSGNKSFDIQIIGYPGSNLPLQEIGAGDVVSIGPGI